MLCLNGKEIKRYQAGKCFDGEEFQKQLVVNCMEMTFEKDEGVDDCIRRDSGKREGGSTESPKIREDGFRFLSRSVHVRLLPFLQSRPKTFDGSNFTL